MSFSREISVTDLLSKEAIKLHISEPKKNRLLQFLCACMSNAYPDVDQKQFFGEILKRENTLSTGIGNRIAIPHAIAENTKKLHLFFATHTGIEYDSLDCKLVQIIFMLAIPSAEKQLYTSFLIQVSKLMQNHGLRGDLIKSKTPEQVIGLFKKYENNKQ